MYSFYIGAQLVPLLKIEHTRLLTSCLCAIFRTASALQCHVMHVHVLWLLRIALTVYCQTLEATYINFGNVAVATHDSNTVGETLKITDNKIHNLL